MAPMSLTTQSLSSSYYARDQITAFHLAQEAIESIRHARDNNVLKNALGILTDGRQTDLLEDIPKNTDFIVDTTNDDDMDSDACDNGCPVLRKSSDGLYGYGSNWTPTQFTRTVRATFVPVAETPSDEIKLTVTVSWQTGSFRTRSFTISDNLYRWVNDGSAER
ncbi:MAG: hypothetical protein Q7S01_02530 [bacterium]|nr:hypothetical protein [bacterium]